MRENEIVIYGILKDKSVLDTAIKKLNITQYETDKSVDGITKYSYRVRETINGYLKVYELTNKKRIETPSLNSSEEKNSVITSETFELIKGIFDFVVKKQRYVLCVDDVTFRITDGGTDHLITMNGVLVEVDVFNNTNWVKIDIEIDLLLEKMTELKLSNQTALTIPKKLIPVGLDDHFLSTTEKQEEKDIIRELYKKYFKEFNHD